MLNKLATALAALLALAACSKKDQQQAPPPPPEKYEVITTGTLFNETNGRYEAACFLNNNRKILESGGASQAFAYGIEKNGSDLYISGGFGKKITAADDMILMPCYWKNGKKIDLATISLDIDYRCGASDIKWFNGTLFILGDADLEPVLWREENAAASITQFGWEQDVVDVRKTGNMEVYNGRLYIGGNQQKLINGKMVYNAGYWTVDQNDKMEFHVVEADLEYALCFSIAVSDQGIFLAGESGKPGQAKPTVWSQQGRLPISNSFNATIHRLQKSVTDSKGNLYLNVRDIQSYQPVIWKVSSIGNHELIKADVPANAKGFCEGVDIKDDKLAYVYQYQQENLYKAAYVFNDKTFSLDINNSPLSTINSMKIFSK